MPRKIEPHLRTAAANFPAILLTGPRRSGKTTLLRHIFSKAAYLLLEEPDTLARMRADPRGFLEQAGTEEQIILDEIQNAPELFNYIRAVIDTNPERMGQWILTGSQEAGLMKGVTESMAGRAAVFQLLPFSTSESSRVSLLHGGFPEVLFKPHIASTWFRSYVQTYLERDVRSVSNITDLATYRRFMGILSTRTGQLLNKTELAAPLGVSVPTIASWLSILEITGQIILVPPFYENFGKRLVKSPKLYFTDSGLACHLLGIETEEALGKSPFLGPIFEGFIAAEIAKHRINNNRRCELYYFRDRIGLEVDFIVPLGERRLALIECKASSTIHPADARPMNLLEKAIDTYEITRILVHRGKQPASTAGPGVTAANVEDMLKRLEETR